MLYSELEDHNGIFCPGIILNNTKNYIGYVGSFGSIVTVGLFYW